MKIVFVHLSDIHFKASSTAINKKTSKLIDAIKSVSNVDNYIVICSGDTCNSGHIDEYKVAKKFFGHILSELGKHIKKFIYFYIVPGNHDMVLGNDSRTWQEIHNYYVNKSVNEKLLTEIESLEAFFDYAASKHCFKQNKICHLNRINLDGFVIQFVLLNTAPFSTLKPDNKELHYLPINSIDLIRKDESTSLLVTIMHHSTEWFNYESKSAIEAALYNNCDILFSGHDHQSEFESTTINGNKSLLISKGGEYSDNSNRGSSFSINILETENMQFTEIIYKWDQKNQLFIGEASIVNVIKKKSHTISVKVDFINKFMIDSNYNGIELKDYFVFPLLTPKNVIKIKDNTRVTDESSFFEIIKNAKIVNIIGNSGIGKTAFLKFIYIKLLERGNYPLYIGKEDVKKKRIHRLIDDLFTEQYSENPIDMEQYHQSTKDKKIVLIDDFDKLISVGMQDAVLASLRENVGQIICTSDESSLFDITNSTKHEFDKDGKILTYSISGFYKSKRTELTKRICEKSGLKKEEIDKVIITLDHFAQKSPGLFRYSPEYILIYLDNILKDGNPDKKDEQVVSVVFENNLRTALSNSASSKYLPEYLILLEELAYRMHFSRQESCNLNFIQNIVDNYNTVYDMKVDILKLINAAKESHILIFNEENLLYKFSNKNTFAYFVACKLNKDKNKNIATLASDLDYIIRNICFSINSNILVFLSYLRDSTEFVIKLCEESDTLLKDFEELDFNTWFFKSKNGLNIGQPGVTQKKAYLEERDKIEEKSEIMGKEIGYIGLYDYDENDINLPKYKLLRALRYLEMVSKTFTNQFSSLESDKKKLVVKSLYILPNRVLSGILLPLFNNYDKFIDDLHDSIKDANLFKDYTKDDLETFVYETCICICLSVYDNLAYYSSNSKTINSLDKFGLISMNHTIQNLIMYENGLGSEEFFKKAIDIISKNKNVFIHSMVRIVSRKHIITKEHISHRILDRAADKIFEGHSKKELIALSHGSV